MSATANGAVSWIMGVSPVCCSVGVTLRQCWSLLFCPVLLSKWDAKLLIHPGTGPLSSARLTCWSLDKAVFCGPTLRAPKALYKTEASSVKLDWTLKSFSDHQNWCCDFKLLPLSFMSEARKSSLQIRAYFTLFKPIRRISLIVWTHFQCPNASDWCFVREGW